MFCQRLFCLDSYLTLPSDFVVHHCECQSDSLLVLKGTVGAQKIGVVGNTIQVLLQFSSVYHCQKLCKSTQDQQSYCRNKKGAVFLKHSVVTVVMCYCSEHQQEAIVCFNTTEQWTGVKSKDSGCLESERTQSTWSCC